MLPRMMARVLEPEVMDTIEDAEEYDAMDFVEPDTRFAEAALELVRSRPRPRVLDLGTGTARIPFLMLERRADLDILGVDMSTSMLTVARRSALARGLGDRLELREMDAKALAVEAASYDLVISNSVAHHIPDPTDLFRQIARAVRPDGAILVRDLFRPETDDSAMEIVERVAPDDTDKQKKLLFDSLKAALTVGEVREMAHRAGLRDVVVAKVSDRHWSLERGLRLEE